MVSSEIRVAGSRKPLAFVLPLLLIIAGGIWWSTRSVDKTRPEETAPPRRKLTGTAVKPQPRPSGYVGSEACAKCHPAIAESYVKHPMYRSAGRTPGPEDVENFENGTEFTFDDGRLYRVVKENDGIYHHEILRDKQGEVVYDESAKIAFFIGSGTRGKSYCIDRDGLLFQSPISWFTSEQKWDISPGYVRRHARFGRRIPEQCVQCHAGHPTTDAARENYFPEPVMIEAAIGCERCHGPGEQHISLHESGQADKGDDPIVNPAGLSPDRREAVCYQCHLIGKTQILRYGRSFDDFRPGDRVDDIWSVMVTGTGVRGDRKTKAVSHVEQMRDSTCFKASDGRLGCTSCHDPHYDPNHDPHAAPDKAKTEAYYRQRCLTCHGERGCSLPAEQQAAAPANNSCIHCHMPKLTAHDIAHASQTDHRLLRSFEDEEDPFPTRELEEMELFDREHTAMPEWELERALALAKVHQLREAAYASPKDAEQVEQTLTDVTEIAPDDFASWNALGAARDLRQDVGRAEEAWKRALALKPANEQVLDSLAGLCQKKSAWQDGLEYMDRLIELNPWRARDHLRRATFLSEAGRWPEALADAETALELDPTDRNARRWLINAAQTVGDLQTSRRHAAILNRMSD